MSRDVPKPFDGEAQIIQTLTSDPRKLYLDVQKDFDALRDKAEDLLWPANQVETRWVDILDRYAEQAGMPWLPPRGLEQLKEIAINRGLWEDLGNHKAAAQKADVRAGDRRVRAGRYGARPPEGQPVERWTRSAHPLRRGRGQVQPPA